MAELLSPSDLSQELREGESGDLTRRRRGIALSVVGAVIGGVVTLYQTGVVKRLPDILPGEIWDAEKVDASDYAYRHLQQPDAPMMMVTYGLTAMALAAGGKDRARQNPALPVVATLKAVGDFVTCLALARQEWAENRKLCSYCQVATAISGTTVALTLPETLKALGARREAAA
jgi:uncharacterized membrane protein